MILHLILIYGNHVLGMKLPKFSLFKPTIECCDFLEFPIAGFQELHGAKKATSKLLGSASMLIMEDLTRFRVLALERHLENLIRNFSMPSSNY